MIMTDGPQTCLNVADRCLMIGIMAGAVVAFWFFMFGISHLAEVYHAGSDHRIFSAVDSVANL